MFYIFVLLIIRYSFGDSIIKFGVVSFPQLQLGWGFHTANGRAEAHFILQSKFPNHTIVSEYSEDFEGAADVTKDWFQRGFQIILYGSPYFGALAVESAKLYPTIGFFCANCLVPSDSPNLVRFLSLEYEATYLNGIVAGSLAKNGVVCVVDPILTPDNSRANGFFAGARFSNPNIKTILVNTPAWSDPERETVASQILLANGCEVLQPFSDGEILYSLFKSEKRFNTGKVNNWGLYYGDTILVSYVLDWKLVYVNVISQWARTGKFESKVVRAGLNHPDFLGHLSVTGYSVLVPQSVKSKVIDRQTYFKGKEIVFCDSNKCSTPDEIAAMPYPSDTKVFIAKLPTDVCKAGEWFVFNALINSYTCTPCSPGFYSNIPLPKCLPCLQNTYQPNPGSSMCLPCPSEHSSDPQSSSCKKIGFSVPADIIGGIVGLFAFLSIALALGIFIRRIRRNRRILAGAPSGLVTIVFSDVQSSTELWALDPNAMRKMLAKHNDVIRRLIKSHCGYEVKTQGDSFMVAFCDAEAAIRWCKDVQYELLYLDWANTLEHPSVKEEYDIDGNPLFRGLRVRMGVNTGMPDPELDPVTLRVDYYGSDVNIAARVVSLGHGGQVLVSKNTCDSTYHSFDYISLGLQPLKGIELPQEVYQLQIPKLSMRKFGSLNIKSSDSSPPSMGEGTCFRCMRPIFCRNCKSQPKGSNKDTQNNTHTRSNSVCTPRSNV